MKKVLFIFILLVFFNLTLVDAKTIITTTGTDKTNAISSTNDQINPGIYNWAKEFDYPINYYNSQEGKLIPSLFSVNDKTTLQNGRVFSTLVNNKDDGKDYLVSKTLPIKNDIYLMFGAMKINDNYVPVINYYEKNILIWQYTYSDIGRGKFVSGVIGDGVIHCLGEYEQYDSFTTDILVIEISLTGVLNQMKLIKGNQDAKAHEIYQSRYGIYFVTETASYTLDYDGVSAISKGIFLNKLSNNYETLSMFCVKNFSGADYFASMMEDDQLIVYLAVKGMGDFPYNSPGGYTEALVCLDEYAEDVMFNKLDRNYYMGNNILLSDNNSYYIGGYDSEKHEIKIFEYSKEFRYKKIRTFNVLNPEETVLNINNVKIMDNHILVINTENIYSSRQKYYYFCINKYMLKSDFLDFIVEGEEYTNISYYNNYIYLSLTKKTNNRNVLFVYKVALVKLSDRNYINNQKEYINTFMTVNYQEISGENRMFEDVNTLKTNHYYYVQDDGDLMCINEARVSMLPTTNILAETIYDLGKKISFNGKGYLNNIRVSSGYTINDPGFYILKQESEEGDYYITEFYIENLKTVVPKEKINNEKLEVVIIDDIIKEKEIIELKLNEQPNSNFSKNDFRIYIFIMSTLIFIGTAIFFPKKYLRRNNK